MVDHSEMGVTYGNWLAVAWAQYELRENSISMMGQANLTALFLALFYNAFSFILFRNLHAQLCAYEPFVSDGLCEGVILEL
jgi:hypothetical protein